MKLDWLLLFYFALLDCRTGPYYWRMLASSTPLKDIDRSVSCGGCYFLHGTNKIVMAKRMSFDVLKRHAQVKRALYIS